MTFFQTDRLSIELAGNGVAQVRLTRGDKMNALDPAMFESIIAAGDTLAGEKGVRAVVLSGEGRSFCAGLDLMSMNKDPDAPRKDLTERTHGDSNDFQQVATTWRKLPVPVIAAIHGVCFGGGMQIASGADIRIATADARMAIMEMKWGLVPDMGGYALWRGLVRDDILRELVYTNREFSGEEAQQLGLVTMVDSDPLARATRIADTIAARNPDAVRAAKRLSNAMYEHGNDDLLLAESREQGALIGKPNQVEAVMAGMARRDPDFADAA